MTIQDLPALNACLNGLAGLLLLAGRALIKRGNRRAHQVLMLAAVAVSAAFLACYLYYHTHVGVVTRYQGEGLWRLVYFFILITHVALAPVVPPASLAAVALAWRGRLAGHVRLVRWLWPAWIYVSLSGVLVYLFLYVL